MSYYPNLPVFPSGELLVTETVRSRGFVYLPLLRRHLAGDFGDVCKYTQDENRLAIAGNCEVLSQFTALDRNSVQELLTIVTSGDRSYTVIFLPDEGE